MPDSVKLVFVTGGVEKVDAQNGMITLWLNGFTGLHETPIADGMPDWMLEPRASFRAYIPEENCRRGDLDGVTWTNIEPQEYTDLTEDELIESLDEIFMEMDLAVK